MQNRIEEAIAEFIGNLTVKVLIDGYETQTKIIDVNMGGKEIKIELPLGIKDMITYMPFKYNPTQHKFMFTQQEIEEFDEYPF